MGKIYLILLFGLVLVFSCKCNDNSADNQDKDSVIKSANDNKSLVSDNKNEQGEAEKIDPEFKNFLEKFEKKSLPYQENPTGNEKFEKIQLNEQVNFLSKSEKLSRKDFEEMADYTDFYYISNPLNTNKFHAVVYGRFEMGSTYYFLCTFNNKGKLISNIDFAAYELMGAGPQAGQEFNTKGTIDESMEVTVKSNEETRNYKIQEDGKIVRL
jgi:hypothetical protein